MEPVFTRRKIDQRLPKEADDSICALTDAMNQLRISVTCPPDLLATLGALSRAKPYISRHRILRIAARLGLDYLTAVDDIAFAQALQADLASSRCPSPDASVPLDGESLRT